MNFQKKIQNIKKSSKNAKLIVVTKHQSIDTIKKIYKIGERHFGENRVQELINKKEILPKDIKWHMIGRLQRNKVKLITPFIYMIQSVDSLKLLETINKYAELNQRKVKCLIQVKISQEELKSGFTKDQALQLLKSNYKKKYQHVSICGIMGMATFTNNRQKIKQDFKTIQSIYNQLKKPDQILSIGMSNDYKIACQYDSNMIRIGSLIFNENN